MEGMQVPFGFRYISPHDNIPVSTKGKPVKTHSPKSGQRVNSRRQTRFDSIALQRSDSPELPSKSRFSSSPKAVGRKMNPNVKFSALRLETLNNNPQNIQNE